jgi:signal transduction histidine kinase
MSHELRTPLNAIIGFSEIMYDERFGPLNDVYRDFVNDVLHNSRHLLQVINDVLDLSKVESGRMEFSPEAVSMNAILAEVLDTVRAEATAKMIKLSVAIEPTCSYLVVDVSRLKQILFNYLSNAIKFTSEGGRVNVEVRPAGTDDIVIAVTDTGIGICPDDIALLFQQFQQLDSGKSKLHQGTGLGLALVKRIVEAQGGRVAVESKLGEGSTFYAYLPRELSAERLATQPA